MSVDLTSTNTTRWYTAPDHPAFDIPVGDMSIISIVKPSSISDQYNYLFANSSTIGANLTWAYIGFDDITWNYNEGFNNVILSNVIEADEWQIATFNIRNGEKYIEHCLVGSSTVSKSAVKTTGLGAFTNANTWYFYQRNDETTERAFKGQGAHHIHIVGRSLSADDLRDLANGKPMEETEWWAHRRIHAHFADPGQTSIRDLTGQHTLTQVGSSFGIAVEEPNINVFDPYRDFKYFTPILSGGATTYTITPSGGVVISGNNTVAFTDFIEITPSGGITISGSNQIIPQNFFTISPTGGVEFSGTNTITFGTVANDYTITPSGGVIISGANAIASQYFYTISPSGGVVFSGANGITLEKAYTIVPDGGVTFSGTNGWLIGKIINMNGGVVFQGSNPITSNTVTASTRLPLTGVGK